MAETNLPDDPRRDETRQDVHIRTFLIADVRGWTLFTQERGDEAAAKLAAKFADVVREVVEARGGTLLELRGDEAMCVFSSAREAIRSAVDLQMRFVEETIDQPDLPLTIGIGLDAGEAVPVQGGYRGAALNLAARLCGQARAGEVLASREVTHLARRLDGIRYEDRGALTFKNIPDPVEVVRVAPEGVDPIERLRPFTPSTPPPAKRSRRWTVAVGVAAVVALIGISIPLLRSDEPGPVALGSNTVARFDTADGSVRSTTSLRQRPGATATGFGSVWVAYPDGRTVERLDAATGTRSDTIEVGSSPSGIAIGEGSVWVTSAGDGTVTRIDPETGIPTKTFRAGAGPAGVAVGGGAIWVADGVGASLLRIDPASGRSDVVELDGLPTSVTFADEGVWVAVAPAEAVLVDPDDLRVTLSQPTGARPTAIVRAFDSIWVANDVDGTVSRLDPSTGTERATITVGDGPTSIVSAGDRLWVAVEHDDTVVAIDPETDTVDRRLRVGATAASIASTGDSLWIAVGASATEHRGGILTISSSGPLFDPEAPSLDPAISYDEDAWRILAATNDGLLAYERVGGPDGASLVPDLASALPDVSDDGLTYRFPLREGIRYSTGDPVRAEDFRRALERAVVMHGAGYLYSAIRGTSACRPDPPTCDLRDGIEAHVGSVTFHLERPDAELPSKLALSMAYAVPAATPFEDQGLDALPATGPYMVDRATTDRLELVRNPEFEEWSGAAQPQGFVDAISWRSNEGVESAYDRLTAGDLAVMIDEPLAVDLESLRSTGPDQVVQAPRPLEYFVGFDVQKAPFDDRRVREAMNYAIDRGRVMEFLGGSTSMRPTCQILPPTFPGYLPYCPYTQEPEPGVWSAPDPDRASELVDAAGVRGTPVTVAVSTNGEGLPPGAVETMTYVTEVLNQLGLRAELVDMPVEEYFSSINPPQAGGTPAGVPRHPHVFLSGWISDYLGPGNMIEPQFHCGDLGAVNTSGYCNEALDERMEDALRLSTGEPGASNRAWAAIDHDLVDEAVHVPLTNPVITHVVSDRVGNVQLNPPWGLLLSLLWVR